MAENRRLANRVLLIGWDAADWQMIRPLIASGAMPRLEKLIRQGTTGNLATIQPVLSPMLWTSIATGKRAYKHGIYGFVEPIPDGSGIRPTTSTSRTTKALWNILSQNGLSSNVVGWFASHPAEPIRGCVVSDYYVHPSAISDSQEPLPTDICHPHRLAVPLAHLQVHPAQLDAQALLPFIPQAARIDLRKDRRVHQLATLLARASSIQSAACAVMANEPWDFTAVYFDAIDQFGHHFMPYHPPRVEGVSEEDAELYGEVMTGCYRFHDMMLEAMLDLAGPDTTVLLVSDHGFHSGSHRRGADAFENPPAWHRQQGILCASGPGIRPQQTLHGASLLDVTPTILALLGLPVGDDMDGRPWLEVLEDASPPERIESWDTVNGECGSHPPDRREDSMASAEAIRHLVDLGYIDPPTDDVQQTIEKAMVELRTNRAISLVDGGRIDEALAAWQQVLELSPDAAFARSCRGEIARCYLRLQRYEECEQLLTELLDEQPADPAFRLLLAQLKLRCQKPHDALDLLREVQGTANILQARHNLEGQAHLQLHQTDRAEAAFGETLNIDGENAEAWAGLAAIYLEQKNYARATELALQAVSLDHRLPMAHLTLGCALAELGQLEEATLALETAVRMAPAMTLAQQRLDAVKARRRGL